MAFFYKDAKPGRGIGKDEPKKKGIALFFELYIRKFWAYMLLNVLFIITSLPAIAIYSILLIYYAQAQDLDMLLTCIFAAIMLVILLGGGPTTAGYHYVLRNYVREEHSFLWSDFFEHTKKNFIQSMMMWVIDVIVVALLITNARFYVAVASQGTFHLVALAVFSVFCAFYVMLHFFIWTMMVTFKLSLWPIVRNSFILVVASLYRNLLGVIIAAGCFFALSTLSVYISIPFLLIMGAAPLGLIFQMISYKTLKKYMLDPALAAEEAAKENEECDLEEKLWQTYDNDVAALFRSKEHSDK